MSDEINSQPELLPAGYSADNEAKTNQVSDAGQGFSQVVVSKDNDGELLRLRQAIGWVCDAADAAYNEDSSNIRIHEIFNIAAQAAGLTRRLPDEYERFTEDSE